VQPTAGHCHLCQSSAPHWTSLCMHRWHLRQAGRGQQQPVRAHHGQLQVAWQSLEATPVHQPAMHKTAWGA
jgi:hypothetical protein